MIILENKSGNTRSVSYTTSRTNANVDVIDRAVAGGGVGQSSEGRLVRERFSNLLKTSCMPLKRRPLLRDFSPQEARKHLP